MNRSEWLTMWLFTCNLKDNTRKCVQFGHRKTEVELFIVNITPPSIKWGVKLEVKKCIVNITPPSIKWGVKLEVKKCIVNITPPMYKMGCILGV